MKYRKRPVVVEAMQYNGTPESRSQISKWGKSRVSVGASSYALVIETLEGTMHAMPGDWIIKGVKGEFYPCKPDIFDATYEPVDDSD